MTRHKSELHPENQWFWTLPESPLKAAVIELWDFARLHGLCMDLCGQGCAKGAMERVRNMDPKEDRKS